MVRRDEERGGRGTRRGVARQASRVGRARTVEQEEEERGRPSVEVRWGGEAEEYELRSRRSEEPEEDEARGSHRGFAAMDPEQRRELSHRGGRARWD